MPIEDILTSYTKAKSQIRNKTLFKASDSEFNGIQMCLNYTQAMEGVIRDLFNVSSPDTKKIAVFLYGSLGRKEMISESDIDILILHDKKMNKPIRI